MVNAGLILCKAAGCEPKSHYQCTCRAHGYGCNEGSQFRQPRSLYAMLEPLGRECCSAGPSNSPPPDASSRAGVLSAEIIKIRARERLGAALDPVEPDLDAVQPPEHYGDVAMD